MDGSAHHNGSLTYFDHEYGGFSKLLTRESELLNVGTHTIKIAVQDVGDPVVDSAIFIPTNGFKAFTFVKGDYNLDGFVNAGDYVVWRDNQGKTNAKVTDGDGDADGTVDNENYTVWVNNYGNSGNTDFCADFNRDSVVNESDTLIMSPYYEVLNECASRFEGDADGDGDVDGCDLDIWGSENSSGAPVRPCECVPGGEGLMAATGGGTSVSKEQIPPSPDVDGDGDVDESDLATIDAILGLTAADQPPLEESAVAPTPAAPSAPAPESPPAQEQSFLPPPGAAR